MNRKLAVMKRLSEATHLFTDELQPGERETLDELVNDGYVSIEYGPRGDCYTLTIDGEFALSLWHLFKGDTMAINRAPLWEEESNG